MGQKGQKGRDKPASPSYLYNKYICIGRIETSVRSVPIVPFVPKRSQSEISQITIQTHNNAYAHNHINRIRDI
jgi:hypothetical protein